MLQPVELEGGKTHGVTIRWQVYGIVIKLYNIIGYTNS
jgi:hypothetical protein